MGLAISIWSILGPHHLHLVQVVDEHPTALVALLAAVYPVHVHHNTVTVLDHRHELAARHHLQAII
jgi:hypothetical protein